MRGKIHTFLNNNKVKYSLFGALFGCGFPCIAYFILDRPELLFGIICTAPLFLGAFAYFAGAKQDNIEDEVKERTLELHTAKLEIANALDVKTKFLATMSHEIRTPLNAIVSCVTLLKTNVFKRENLELLNTISDSGQMLLTLINDILDLSKIEAGKLHVENNPFHFLNASKQIFSLYENKSNKVKVEFAVENEEEMPVFVVGDIVRFKQVFANILDNAIKFAHSKVEIKVFAKKHEDYYRIGASIRDDGIGIRTTDLPKLFKDFEQADLSTTRKYGGTGLGLSICKRLVDKFNGDISIESSPGKGSTFSFFFCLKEKAGYKPQKSKGLEKFDRNFSFKYPLQILVVEDNKVNQLVIRKVFEKLGYHITLAPDGEECLKLLDSLEFDIIFMDMNMPKLDGLETTKKIRNDLQSDVIIFALTANAFNEDKKNCLDAGMNGFLTKPLHIQEITDVLIKTCERLSKTKSA